MLFILDGSKMMEVNNDNLQHVINDGRLNCVDLFSDLYKRVMVWITMVSTMELVVLMRLTFN
jgi:hypothetical protein